MEEYMELVFDCDFEGGLLISSATWFNSISDDLSTTFCIILDVDGQTQLVCDFPEQNWSDVWTHFSNKVLRLCNSGIAAICVLRPGTYRVKFNVENNPPKHAFHFSNLEVKGSVFIAEAGNFLETIYSGKEYDFQSLEVSQNFYELYYDLEGSEEENLLRVFFKKVNKFNNFIQKLIVIPDIL